MLDPNEYLHPDKECLTREQIDALQVERLQATIRHCMNSPFYKKKFEEMGIKPEDIKTPNCLSLPNKICETTIRLVWLACH